MIGGRVLDVTAIVGFSTGESVYTEALVMTAIEENIVLTIPSAALVRAAALILPGHELGLDVLLGLPCTVVDTLDTAQARTIGVVYCAQRRGWPVVTRDPQPLLALDSSIEIEILS